jgi:hypothetical protein
MRRISPLFLGFPPTFAAFDRIPADFRRFSGHIRDTVNAPHPPPTSPAGPGSGDGTHAPESTEDQREP